MKSKMIKFILFFVYFILTGYLYHYCNSIFLFEYTGMPEAVEEFLFVLPLLLVNILGGALLGIKLKLFCNNIILKLLLCIIAGCVVSFFSWFFVLVFEYSKIMSDF